MYYIKCYANIDRDPITHEQISGSKFKVVDADSLPAWQIEDLDGSGQDGPSYWLEDEAGNTICEVDYKADADLIRRLISESGIIPKASRKD